MQPVRVQNPARCCLRQQWLGTTLQLSLADIAGQAQGFCTAQGLAHVARMGCCNIMPSCLMQLHIVTALKCTSRGHLHFRGPVGAIKASPWW